MAARSQEILSGVQMGRHTDDLLLGAEQREEALFFFKYIFFVLKWKMHIQEIADCKIFNQFIFKELCAVICCPKMGFFS